MPKQKLFDDDSEEEVDIKTENEYAKKYDTWRGKEEIHKLEQKYGSNVLISDPSISSDSEDESDELLEESPEMETQFLKTLALLKTKDPRIYDPEFKFFDEKEKELVTESKQKTLTFADSDDDDDDDGNIFSIEKKAEVELDLDDKSKSGSDNKIGQDGKLKDYLVGKVEKIDNTVAKDLEPLKALWSDPKLNEGEAFLRDYILNKKYLECGDPGELEGRLRDDEELGADEKIVEEQDKFERAFNFRFEEPDQDYLKRFPRTMSFIRPKDDRRSKKRVELRTRKEEVKARKMDEIARLKALKLQEIQEKIAKIKEVTGNDELAFKDEDIEGDFDPLEHDRRMRSIFDSQYYGHEDHEKPVFPDLDKELEIENWDDYSPEQEAKEAQDFSMTSEPPHCEDDDFNMDADYDPAAARSNLLEEMRASLGNKRRNRKNKSKLARLLTADKPKYIPHQDTTYDQYMEEYYNMDCEDVIGGDLPTRFKYREVVPNDYGLTIEEILLADDKELTQWVPLKRIVRHKPESEQKSEVNAFKQKATDTTLKRKVLPSLFKNLPEEPELVVTPEENSKKKKKKKKSKKKNDKEESANAVVSENIDEIPNAVEISEQKTEEVREKVGKKIKRKDTDVSKIDISSGIENGDGNVDTDTEDKQENGSQSVVKNKTNDTTLENGDGVTTDNVEGTKSELSKRQKKNLRKKLKKKGIVVENVNNITPSKNSQNNAVAKKRKLSENNLVSNKKQKINNKKENKPFDKEGKKTPEQKNKTPDIKEQKNKKPDKNEQKNKTPDKKEQKNKDLVKTESKIKDIKNKKFKNKDKKNNDRFKNKIKQIIDKSKIHDPVNPMNTLSDERLKAYGLNPKKYRGFLKYKKF